MTANPTDQEYQRLFGLFVRSSDEKPKLREQLLRVVGTLPRRGSFLDVGGGGGDLTVPLAGHFAHTTVVEPNQALADRFRRHHQEMEVFDRPFEQLDLEPRRFDFVLCSHVLYYVPEPQWCAQVARMHALLNPGGRVAVVMQSPAGDVSRFMRHFTGGVVDVIPLWDDLVANYGEGAVEARYCRTRIETGSLDDLVDIGLFLLMDKQFQGCAAEVREYVETRHRVGEGFRLHQGQIVLIVTREGR